MNLILSLIFLTIAQVLAYFQLQGQFIWSFAKSNPILLSLLGVPISLFLIYFTRFCALAFDGQVWPGRLIGFSVGAIVFAFLSHYVLGEAFTQKTIISLGLAFLILFVQIFWK